jgi:hypothetical protein
MTKPTLRHMLVIAGCWVFCIGCGKKAEESGAQESKRDIGTQAGDTINDERVLRAANAAANEVVRNTADCEALRAALPDTLRQIDEAQAKVRTATGRQMVDALRTRVRNAATLCP